MRSFIKIGFFLYLVLFLSSCSLNNSSSGGGGSSADYQFLYDHNAQNLDGYTIRWDSTIIKVHAGGIEGVESAINRWVGPVNFNFVNAPPPDGISFSFTNSSSYCGSTTYYYYNSGRLYRAVIRINYDQSRCRGGLENTLTHEMGHALGFFGHTTDGTLMDPDGGNGEITRQVRNFMNLLYASPYGTDISPYLSFRKRITGRYQPNGTQTIVGVEY
ncbi:MAG: hypothetical protein HY787_09780 [Deltaproteobacteria bacterium]|nr:hypothetical protein [Deltaproteobacteria bacterium]